MFENLPCQTFEFIVLDITLGMCVQAHPD